MAGKEDVFDSFEQAIAARPTGNPWSSGSTAGRFVPGHHGGALGTRAQRLPARARRWPSLERRS